MSLVASDREEHICNLCGAPWGSPGCLRGTSGARHANRVRLETWRPVGISPIDHAIRLAQS